AGGVRASARPGRFRRPHPLQCPPQLRGRPAPGEGGRTHRPGHGELRARRLEPRARSRRGAAAVPDRGTDGDMTEPATLAEAQREIERLRARAEVDAQSALLQSIRASARSVDALHHANAVNIIRSSTSWKLTAPLRAAVFLATRGPGAGMRVGRRVAKVVAEQGVSTAAAKLRRRVRLGVGRLIRPRKAAGTEAAAAAPPAILPAPGLLAPRVLI